MSWKSEILKSCFNLGPPLCRWPLSIGSLSFSSGLSYHCQALIPAPILHVACWTLHGDDWWAVSRVSLPKKVNLISLTYQTPDLPLPIYILRSIFKMKLSYSCIIVAFQFRLLVEKLKRGSYSLPGYVSWLGGIKRSYAVDRLTPCKKRHFEMFSLETLLVQVDQFI